MKYQRLHNKVVIDTTNIQSRHQSQAISTAVRTGIVHFINVTWFLFLKARGLVSCNAEEVICKAPFHLSLKYMQRYFCFGMQKDHNLHNSHQQASYWNNQYWKSYYFNKKCMLILSERFSCGVFCDERIYQICQKRNWRFLIRFTVRNLTKVSTFKWLKNVTFILARSPQNKDLLPVKSGNSPRILYYESFE